MPVRNRIAQLLEDCLDGNSYDILANPADNKEYTVTVKKGRCNKKICMHNLLFDARTMTMFYETKIHSVIQ